MITNDEIINILNKLFRESSNKFDAPNTVMNDFHYVHVKALRNLVKEAYMKGREQGYKESYDHIEALRTLVREAYMKGRETGKDIDLFRTDSKALNRNDIHPVCRH
jgi:hypothetical protein